MAEPGAGGDRDLRGGDGRVAGGGSNPRLLKGLGEEDHIIPSRAKLAIGGHITRQGQYQAFDELAIWSRPLTAREVKALYNNGYGAQIELNK